MNLYNELMGELATLQERKDADCFVAISEKKKEIVRDVDILFARKCSVTGKGMNSGFVIQGSRYIAQEKDALKVVVSEGFKNLKDAYEQEYCYFTEWNDFDDMEYILFGGVLFELDTIKRDGFVFLDEYSTIEFLNYNELSYKLFDCDGVVFAHLYGVDGYEGTMYVWNDAESKRDYLTINDVITYLSDLRVWKSPVKLMYLNGGL
jgi:hypothetical protein